MDNSFSIKEPQMDTDKNGSKPSVFICFYPWFIHEKWNLSTSILDTIILNRR